MTLIDSGADLSVMDQSVAEELGIKNLTKARGCVTANGEDFKVCGACFVKFHIGNKWINFRITVVEDL